MSNCKIFQKVIHTNNHIILGFVFNFLQAEAHEVVIRNASYLCDVAESLSSAQEERVYQSFIDLPIWTSSPHDLIASLCDDWEVFSRKKEDPVVKFPNCDSGMFFCVDFSI